MEGAGTHTLKKFLIFLISSILTWLKHYAKSVPWKHSGWIQRNGERELLQQVMLLTESLHQATIIQLGQILQMGIGSRE
ncbi:uncharacterized protein [Arachis hypogaea]|uniref:uncharacterized protein isoform X2 n=1 Tax=Arachis hypogaea TaxID=3818 RepID=UPI003B22213D